MTDPPESRLSAPMELALFLLATFALTWLAFLPIILGHTDQRSPAGGALLLLGVGAPSITAFALSALGAGRAGVRRLSRGGARWWVSARCYAIVVLVPGLASGAAWAVAAARGGVAPFSPVIPALVSGLLAGILEELGWSGFAFPRLQARFGFAPAGAAMGVIVALWHLPFFLTPGTTQSASSFPLFLLTLIAARIIFGWVYNASGGSILLMVLLHASGDAWSEVLARGPAVPDTPGLTEAGVFIVVAVLLLRRSSQPATITPRQAIRR